MLPKMTQIIICHKEMWNISAKPNAELPLMISTKTLSMAIVVPAIQTANIEYRNGRIKFKRAFCFI